MATRLFEMSAAAVLFCGCGGAAELNEAEVAYAPVPAAQAPWSGDQPSAGAVAPAPLRGPVAVVAGAPTPPVWVGVVPESGAILASGSDTYAGIWLEVPESAPGERPPMDLALV